MDPKAAAVSRIIQRQYISAFLLNGCTSPEKAKTLKELGIKESPRFKNMESQWVFVKSTDSKYYLDLKALDQYRRRKAILLSIVGITVIIIVLLKVL